MQQLGRFIGIVLAIAGLQLGQAEPERHEAAERVLVSEALEVTSFETKYGLDVVEVPAVPSSLLQESSSALVIRKAPVAGCPFEVRAIVVGEGDVRSFATVVAEEESNIVRVGSKHRFGGQSWRIQKIENDDVVIKSGGRTLRCPLGQ